MGWITFICQIGICICAGVTIIRHFSGTYSADALTLGWAVLSLLVCVPLIAGWCRRCFSQKEQKKHK